MTVRVEHRHGKDDWETPSEVFDLLNEEFGFTLDVCATSVNTKCPVHIDPEEGGDGLTAEWAPDVCWMNPPYSEWQKWVAKASEEASKGATVVALLPARTDTKAFHQYIWQKPDVEIRFIKGRVKFVGAEHGAPFPSMIVVFRPQATRNDREASEQQ